MISGSKGDTPVVSCSKCGREVVMSADIVKCICGEEITKSNGLTESSSGSSRVLLKG